MGRITIFSLTDCPHCKRTKGALKDREIPFLDINLSLYPSKRNDMLTLTDRLTVPQVFFNSEHIGGADDTMKVIDEWETTKKYPTALDYYKEEIESQPDPADPRLAEPTTPPVVEKPPPPRNEEADAVALPGTSGESLSVLEITKKLMECMPREDLAYRGKVYKNAFSGADGVKAIAKHFNLSDEADAVQFGQLLQAREILHHVVNDDHPFGDNQFFYRLQPYHTPSVLNSFRVWTDRVDTDSLALLSRLKKLMFKVESHHTDNNGDFDYVAATTTEDYDIFEEAVCELQGVSMATMDDSTKLAFGINTYNLLIKYAFLKVGIANTTIQRASFFSSVKFNIGGHNYSFNDLENGILRSNARPPYTVSVPFSKNDPRIAFILPKVDCRIHFGLNCGAKSCPPVKKFTADGIQEELRIVAQAFCEQDDNVLIDEEKNELSLTSIMNWFRPDFATSADKLPHTVVTFLRGEKQAKLQRMIDSKKSIKIKFLTYDWGTNASKSKPYDSGYLSAMHFSPKSLLRF